MKKTTGSTRRIMARQKAVAIRQLQDKEVTAVSGAGSYVPTAPGADMEIFPGFYGEPWEPDWPGDSDIITWGINEN